MRHGNPRQNPLFLLVALASAAFGPAHAQLNGCTLDGEHVNPDNGSTTRGKTGLMRCVNREPRELLREEELADGKSIGIQRWYTRGKLMRERSVNARGNTEGLAREWNEQGTLISEGRYINAAAVGVHRSWHDNGKPAFEGRYRNSGSGERGGGRTQPIDIHKSYDDKGQLRREVHHDDKGRPKRERVWNESGQLQSDEELFEDGSRKADTR